MIYPDVTDRRSALILNQFLCSCLDDRKITGSLFGSANLMVMVDGLKTTKGVLKTYSKVAESGNTVTSYFCENCGSTLYRTSTGYPGVVMIKAGCVDDLNAADAKPVLELFGRSHIEWIPYIEGIETNSMGLYSDLVGIYSGEETSSA
jgi:hypothetical protein